LSNFFQANKQSDFSIYQKNVGLVSAHYIPGLDGLRAISVMLVVIAHSGFARYVPGDLGVTVFFFISGFLITNLLISELDKTHAIDIRKFYVRRYLRLSPELYFFVLCCTAISYQFFAVPWLDTLGSIFYFQNYVRIFFPTEIAATPLTFSHLWSLSVEEHFYLVMPSFIWLFRRHLDKFFWVLLALCIIAPLYRWFAFYEVNPHLQPYASIYTDRATETRFDSIIYGCLLALFARKTNYFRSASEPLMIALMAAAIVGLALSVIIRVDLFEHVWKFSLQGAALLIGMYALYNSKSLGHLIFRMLELNFLRFTGRLSYGIYLWHLFPIWFIRYFEAHGVIPERDVSMKIVTLIIAITFAYLAAFLSEQLLLNPIANLRRRFGSAVAN
jgi:peptidoglycan/LPS O-acetylase OafA/YrhL